MKPILLVAALACAAGAETLNEPPALIQVIRKPGVDSSPIRRYVDGRAPVYVFGMTSVTGVTETWFIAAHESFAHIEATDWVTHPASVPPPPEDAMAPARSMVAICRPGWSYRPDQAIRSFAKARYLYVTVHQIRPGMTNEFFESVDLRRWAFDTMNLDRPNLVYQVISGAPTGTYLFLSPLPSLAILDEAWARMPSNPEARAAARAGQKAAADVELSREHLIFRVEPTMSHVSDEFAAEDAGFWRAK